MAYFNFTRLINKYSRSFTVLLQPDEGEETFDDMGEVVKGESTELEMRGAIMAVSERKVYNSNGLYTTDDKMLYMTTKIDNALLGAEVVFRDCKYRIEEIKGKDNEEFTGVYSYVLKWVSVFGGEDNA